MVNVGRTFFVHLIEGVPLILGPLNTSFTVFLLLAFVITDSILSAILDSSQTALHIPCNALWDGYKIADR